jgi:ketosteroid isomerase-like protein
MANDAANVATSYFDAWKANDFDTMRSLVAEDVSFEGPLATLEGAEDYIKGIQGLSQLDFSHLQAKGIDTPLTPIHQKR